MAKPRLNELDYIGKQYNRLKILELSRMGNGVPLKAICRCDCEKIIICNLDHVKRGLTKSCGCLRSDILTDRNLSHGKSRTKLYRKWAGMKTRCYNENENNYKDYGGRGILICDEWKNNYLNFYNWAMDNGYNENLTIERKNVDGNYCPDNCKWATPKEQMNNMRKSVYYEHNGKIQTMSQWADEYNIEYATFAQRLRKYNWSIEKALSTPVKHYHR